MSAQKTISNSFTVTTMEDPVSVQAQYAPNNNPTAGQIHNVWQDGDLYMRTRETDSNVWSSWHKIVGESGGETDYTFGISAYKTTANASTAPSDISTWADAPMAVTTFKPYLWAKVQQKSWNASTQSYDVDSTRYIRLTGEDGASVLAQYAPNDNPSSSQIHDTWQSGDLYMRTKSTSDSSWSSWHKIVGESGGETDFTFNISKNKTSSSATTAPSDCYYQNWQDAPVAPTSTYPYLWMKIVEKTWNASTQSYDSGTARYARVTGEAGANAPYIELSRTTILYNANNEGKSTASQNFPITYALKVNGNTCTISSVYNITISLPSNVTVVSGTKTTSGCTINCTHSVVMSGVITITITGTYNGQTYTASGSITVEANKEGAQGEKGDTGDQGGKGDRGKIGRFYYYAQVWTNSSSVSYAVTDTEAPFFSYGGNYWVFNPTNNGTYTMHDMGTPSSSSANWQIMVTDFKFIIAEAIFSSFAHFGSAIISGDWLISIHGTINGTAYGGTATNPDQYNGRAAYTYFNASYPHTNIGGNFIPNYAVDLLTGKSYQNDAYIKGQVVATSGEFSGTIKAGNTTIVGNLSLTDTNNGLTVFDSDSVPRVNLQPKAISTITTLANDTYSYYTLSKTQSGATSFDVTTEEKSFSLAKYENLDIDKFAVTMYSTGNSGTLYPSNYNTYITLKITHPDGETVTTKDITTSRYNSYGMFENLTAKYRFVAPVAGTYKIKIVVTNSGSWTSGQTSAYASVNARYQSSKDTQVYIAKDGFYAHAGANKLIWAGETETQIRYGFNGIRWDDADQMGNRGMDVVAGIKGSSPNAKPLWMPFYNYVPIFAVGVGTDPYLFTSQYIYNISKYKYAFAIDPYRDRGICVVESGYRDTGNNELESWIVLPPATFTDTDGNSVGLPVGYQVTIINWTGTNIYVVPRVNSNHGGVIVDANRNNNWYADLNGSQSRDTYIYMGSWAGLGVVWLAMHDTQ